MRLLDLNLKETVQYVDTLIESRTPRLQEGSEQLANAIRYAGSRVFKNIKRNPTKAALIAITPGGAAAAIPGAVDAVRAARAGYRRATPVADRAVKRATYANRLKRAASGGDIAAGNVMRGVESIVLRGKLKEANRLHKYLKGMIDTAKTEHIPDDVKAMLKVNLTRQTAGGRFFAGMPSHPFQDVTTGAPRKPKNPFKNPYGLKLKLATLARNERDAVSGRHLPTKHDEVVIPSHVTAEKATTKLPKRSNVLFRGGDFIKGADHHFTSEHPDVAAGYANKHDMASFTHKSGNITAHRAQDADIIRRQPAGTWHGSEDFNRPNRRSKKVIPSHKISGAYQPSYETVISGSPRSELGRYHARPVRDKDFNAGFAINTISGRPAKEVFAKYRRRKESIVTRGKLQESSGNWKKHKYIRKEDKKYVYPQVRVPWVFSQPDLVIKGKRGKHILITGLSGSGKSTDAEKYYPDPIRPVIHLDQFKNKELDKEMPKYLRSKVPHVLEGVQLTSWAKDPDTAGSEWRIKRTSFLQSLWRSFMRHRDHVKNRGVRSAWRPIQRIKHQLMFKRSLEKMFEPKKSRR